MNVKYINSITNEELHIFNKYTERELKHYYEPKEGLFIAESPKVITRALDAGYEPVSILLEDGRTAGEHGEVLSRIGDIPVYMVPHDELATITGYELTSGMQCAMRRKPNPDVTKICKNARRIAVLEDVMNPTNIGAIFRSAAALGIDAVLLTAGCADPLYKRAARVSMGTVFQVPWAYLEEGRGQDNIAEVNEIDSKETGNAVNLMLHSMEFKTVAMALDDAARDIGDPVFENIEKLAIFLGTEGDGLAKSTIADSDYKVMIPMSHGVDSLNVAAASAVAFYQLCK